MSDAGTAVVDESIGNDELTYLTEGGTQAVADLFSRYRVRLERMVKFRLDQRLLGRLDPADVLQDAYLEIARRIGDYLADPAVSFFVWIRQITWQTLLAAHRRHLGQKRNAGQEVSLRKSSRSEATTFSLAQQLVAQLTSPSQIAIRDERLARFRQLIDSMDDVDREILLLRHYEQLSNSEVAETLGLKATAASNRYVRALRRLREILESLPGLRDGLA